jgi:hypothetical protein
VAVEQEESSLCTQIDEWSGKLRTGRIAAGLFLSLANSSPVARKYAAQYSLKKHHAKST